MLLMVKYRENKNILYFEVFVVKIPKILFGVI